MAIYIAMTSVKILTCFKHFLNLAQMELFRASKVCLTLRQFYLCQAEVFGPSPAHEGALFEVAQPVPEVTVDVSVTASTSSGWLDRYYLKNKKNRKKNT